MAAFASAQDLRTYLDGTTLDDGDIDNPGADAEWIAQADLFLELISSDIQAAARNPILKPDEAQTVELAGSWAPDLELPNRPIVSVSSVQVNGLAVDGVGYRWNNRTLLRRGTLPFGEQFDEGPSGDVFNWAGPGSTIRVEYLYGFTAASVPGWVKSMTLRVAARSISNPPQMTQQTFGGFSETFSTLRDGVNHLNMHEVRHLRRRFSKTAGSF